MKYLTIAFLLFYGLGLSQEKLIYEQKIKISQEKNESKKAVLESQLADFLRFTEPQKAYKLAKKNIAKAKKISSTEDLAEVYNNSIRVFKQNDSISDLVNAVDSVMILANKSNHIGLKGKAYFHKGNLETFFKNPEKAMENYYKAVGFLKAAKDNEMLSYTYYFLSYQHSFQENYTESRKYANLCFQTARKTNNPNAISFSFAAMNTIYSDEYYLNKNIETLRKAIDINEKALKYIEKKREYISNNTLFSSYSSNLAEYFFELKDYKKSLYYADFCLSISLKNKTYNAVLSVLLLKSDIARQQGDIKLTEKYLLDAEHYSKTKNVSSLRTLLELQLVLANFYEEQKNDTKSLEYYKKYIDTYQSFINEKGKSETKMLEAKFDAKNKEERINLLEEKNKKQFLFNILLFVFLVLLLGGFYLLYRNYRIKMELKEETLQKKDLEQQKLKTEQENIQLKAEQMQKELMANSLQIKRKNDVLQSVKSKITEAKIDEKSKQKIQILLNEEFRLDKDFEQLKTELSNIHPHFFEKLKEKSSQKLSDLDLKYSGAIYLGMSTKQIAQIFQVEPESVRMSKYRIKQKLGLTKEEDLNDFLLSIIATTPNEFDF